MEDKHSKAYLKVIKETPLDIQRKVKEKIEIMKKEDYQGG